MKVLELFKGSGSITKYYEGSNTEVISLDIVKEYNPTICCDIMDFDYKQYPVGYFDIIWASPECKIYSSIQPILVGRVHKDKEDLIRKQIENSIYINRTIEIIKHLKPRYYFIENPQFSSIWKYIDDIEFKELCINVDYCYFGYDYKKPTKILTNRVLENRKCKCKRHNKLVFKMTGKKQLEEKYSIPQSLLEYLLPKPKKEKKLVLVSSS